MTESLFQLLSKTIFLEAAAVAVVVVVAVVAVVVVILAGVVGCFQSLLKSFSTYCFPSILPGHGISLSLSLTRTRTHAPTHTFSHASSDPLIVYLSHSFLQYTCRKNGFEMELNTLGSCVKTRKIASRYY